MHAIFVFVCIPFETLEYRTTRKLRFVRNFGIEFPFLLLNPNFLPDTIFAGRKAEMFFRK